MKNLLSISIFLTCITVHLSAQVIHVPDDKPSIQAGIDAAVDGDTVLVTDNTYFENINFRGKAITVASLFLMDGDTSHISRTIIDGSDASNPDSASTVNMVSGEDSTSVLTGFTITGGSGTRWQSQFYEINGLYGGGIFINHSGGKISDNIIEDNHIIISTGHPQISYDDWASGGGIAAIVYDNKTVIIRDNIIRNNICEAKNTASGAGIGVAGGNVLIEGNAIHGNSCIESLASYGGGIAYFGHAINEGYTDVNIRNNSIYDNEIFSQTDLLTIDKSQLCAGGGLFVNGFSFDLNMKIFNNLVFNNYTSKEGGGICIEDVIKAQLFNNSIINNKAEDNGNSLYLRATSELIMSNNILWSSESNGQDEISINSYYYEKIHTHSFYNNIRGGWTKGNKDGSGNIDADPEFEEVLFQLSEDSPCIGSGVDSIEIEGKWYYAPVLDFTGNPRPHPIDTRVDIGAIESPYEGFVFIPDTAFLNALIEEGVDTNEDGQISYGEAEIVTKVEIQNDADNPGEIKNMKGIEAFVNTLYLNCSSHQITNLDISNNTSLVNLECHNNKLPVLDISKNTSLEFLICENNHLTSLDISNNTVLEYLSCGTNQLASLDVSQNILLNKLYCSNNQLTNISLNDSLRFLFCSNNQLTNIDVSDCSKLALLNCFNNKLSSLDITDNKGLWRLQCGGNQLTNLDVSECPGLTVLSIGNNEIIYSEWYVMLLQWEYKWDIEPNPILSLDLTNENSISALECGGLNISSLDLRGLELLRTLILNNMSELTRVCVDDLPIGWDWEPQSGGWDTTGSPNLYFTTECTGTGIEATSLSEPTIYPNPTNTLLTIEIEYPDHYSIEITTLNGQQILIGEMKGTSHQIDFSSFQKGVYFITIRSEDFVTTRKIIKL